jgi:hypothetical protein
MKLQVPFRLVFALIVLAIPFFANGQESRPNLFRFEAQLLLPSEGAETGWDRTSTAVEPNAGFGVEGSHEWIADHYGVVVSGGIFRRSLDLVHTWDDWPKPRIERESDRQLAFYIEAGFNVHISMNQVTSCRFGPLAGVTLYSGSQSKYSWGGLSEERHVGFEFGVDRRNFKDRWGLSFGAKIFRVHLSNHTEREAFENVVSLVFGVNR